MLGLLGMGARSGQWAKLTNILESHITGDPTLRFQSINEVDANALFKEPYSEFPHVGVITVALCRHTEFCFAQPLSQ